MAVERLVRKESGDTVIADQARRSLNQLDSELANEIIENLRACLESLRELRKRL